MSFSKTIINILDYLNSIALFGKPYRFSLYSSFIKLLGMRIMKIPLKKVNVMGYTIKYIDFITFHEIFLSIFVKKEYFFASKKKNPTILDCGSNIGLSVLFFKKIYPKSKIIAFEPDPETFTLLSKNITMNKIKGVELVNKAVTSKEGTTTFYIDKDVKSSPGMSIFERLSKQTKTVPIKIDTTKLSSYIKEDIDFLKLDVESSEIDVLSNLSTSRKLRKISEMVVEYHHNTQKENKLSAIIRVLEDNNFEYQINSLIEPPFKRSKKALYNILIHAYKK